MSREDSDNSPVSFRPPAPAVAASTGFRGAKAAGGVGGFCKFGVSGGRCGLEKSGVGGG